MKTSRDKAWRQTAAALSATLLLGLGACSDGPARLPRAGSGILTITPELLDQHGPLPLSGAWEFYWKRLLTPADFRNGSARGPVMLSVPGVWNKTLIDGAPIPADGYATYRLSIRGLPRGAILGLRVEGIGTSSRIFANDSLIMSIGIPAAERASMRPDTRVGICYFQNRDERLDLVIQAANYHDQHGGFWSSIELGTAEQIRAHHDRRLAMDFFLFGVTLVMALYHFGLYSLRRVDRSTLFFGLFCLAMALRALTTGEKFLNQQLGADWWFLTMRINYLTLALGVPAFIGYVGHLFPRETLRAIRYAFYAAGLLYAAVVLAAPPRVFSSILMGYQIITLASILFVITVLIIAVIRRRELALSFLVTGLILATGAINDMLYANMIFLTPFANLTIATLFIFIVSQSALLSYRFSRSFALAEQLGSDLEARVLKRTEDLLRSEERFSRIIDNAHDMIFRHDRAGFFSYINPSGLRLLDYTIDELKTVRYVDLVPPDERDAVASLFHDQISSSSVQSTHEHHLTRRDKTLVFVEVSIEIINDADGNPECFGIARDITERHKADIALRQSEEKYRTILETISEGYFELDLMGNLVFFNDYLSTTFGYTREELRGTNYRKYVTEETARTVFILFNDIYEGRLTEGLIQYDIIRKDGTRRTIEASVTLARDSAGDAAGFRGVGRDVTERLQVERAVLESEKKYRHIIERVTDIIYRNDDSGFFKFVNPAGVQLTGYSMEELLTMRYTDLVQPEYKREVFEFYKFQLDGKFEETYYEFPMLSKGGTIIWIGQNVKLEVMEDGKIEFYCIARDITDRKHSDKAKDDLDRQKSRFFANISHEIRTPLTLILSPIESAIKGDYVPASDHAFLENIYRNGLRLLKLINNLLDLSKIEAGHMTMRVKMARVAPFLDNYVSSVQATAQSRGIAVSFTRPAADIDDLYFDYEMMDKVMMNIIANALKFTETGGSVTLSARDDERFCFIECQDTGPGIPQDKLHVIFDRFGQAEGEATRRNEGTGIGLSLARELTAMHGGTITVASRFEADHPLDHGTTFTVMLPKGRLHLENRGDVTFLNEKARNRGAGGHRYQGWREMHDIMQTTGTSSGIDAPVHVRSGPRILVVDDNPDMRELLASYLASRYDLHLAVDGREGLMRAHELQPDLIITDVMMPVMNGHELTAAVRRDARLRQTPVIMLTARADIDDKIEGLQFGADDYLTKPFNARELLARVQSLLKSHEYERIISERNRVIESELEIARLLQQKLLEGTPADLPGMTVHAAYLPMDKVGGDFYDIRRNGDIVSLFIADVSGHGLAGAFLSLIAKISLEQMGGKSPAGVLAGINEVVCRSTVKSNFITALSCVIDRPNGILRYARAGHPPILLCRRDGTVEELQGRGKPLGWFPDALAEERTVPIAAGDRLLLYTDGVTECYDDTGLFGEERLREFLASTREVTDPAAVAGDLMATLHDFTGKDRFTDDITFLIVDIV